MHVNCLEPDLSHSKHSNGDITIIIKIIVFSPNSASHPKIAR